MLSKERLMKALGQRNLMPLFEKWGFYNEKWSLDDIETVTTVARLDFFHLMDCIKEVRKHCLNTANKVSPRFPLIRLAALYHDASYSLEDGKMKHKDARDEALESAWQMMRHFEFSQAHIKFVRALIRVHDYNLISTNAKRDPKQNQPLRQWRKALIDANAVSRDVNWRSILRLALADCDGKQAWWRKWLARPIIRYFRQHELMGDIVYSRADLAISTEEIFNVCPELDPRRLTEVYDHLLNHVALNGYEYNNRAELVMETVAYIRGKQTDGDILDSRVHLEVL